MNAVEIEQAVSALAEAPFDPAGFPFAFLEAFGNKATTVKRLQSGSTNQSDVSGGVLQRSNIHIQVCPPGEVAAALAALQNSPATQRYKAKFILATDGQTLEAENLADGETIACEYADLGDKFGFFLPLAGITTVKQIKENAFDIKATGRLNKLYIELLKENPNWGAADRRDDLNHFFARLIFCFFAEDTGIFHAGTLFTATIEQMSDRNSANTHEVIAELFRAMNTPANARESANIRSWAMPFPYVNGGLFSKSLEVPRFTRLARSYLLHVGNLDWTKINPDIFGSMIQAVADDEERGALGMHYTSVPNILKVLNPLFLDDLREQLSQAGDGNSAGSGRKLLNLRQRMARIRVFDPACGSGNFLVIAYKQMREIEAEINRRRGEAQRHSEIPLTNFRGIEIRSFAAEIARLALIIAEYQCDVLYRGQKLALAEFLPLEAANWITCGNALRLDWLKICPPTGTGVKIRADDLFSTPLDQTEMDFENEGGETFICGNPPYLGTKYQTKEQKADLADVFRYDGIGFGNSDYVGGWFRIASEYVTRSARTAVALVSTTSLFQGEQAELIFGILQKFELRIPWCHTSFKWSNQAANNAGVSCCIVGVGRYGEGTDGRIYDDASVRLVPNIGPYLVAMPNVVVKKRVASISELNPMSYGSMSNDNNEFTFTFDAYRQSVLNNPDNRRLFKFSVGGNEFIKGLIRPAIYIEPDTQISPEQQEEFGDIFERVRQYRNKSARAATKKLSHTPMFFAERRHASCRKVFVPQIMSEKRQYLSAGLLSADALVIAPHMQILGAELYDLAIISSCLHLVWIATVCGKLENRYRYSNTLGWNTFPVPALTDQNKADLTRCAEEILLAREAHFPATIAELYDPDNMPANLRAAHDRNDETLERIYIGRRFKNDTERLEKLFELYTQMTAKQPASKKPTGRKKKGADA